MLTQEIWHCLYSSCPSALCERIRASARLWRLLCRCLVAVVLVVVVVMVVVVVSDILFENLITTCVRVHMIHNVCVCVHMYRWGGSWTNRIFFLISPYQLFQAGPARLWPVGHTPKMDQMHHRESFLG
jgi:hypothetical protein